jgi:flagellar biosynthesis protein FliR
MEDVEVASWIDALARTNWAPDLAFTMARFAGLFLSAPFFRTSFLPWRLKIGWIGVLAACVAISRVSLPTSFEGETRVTLPSEPIAAALAVSAEVLIGVAIGWSTLLVLGAVESAAQWITQQIGIAAAVVADPIGGTFRITIPDRAVELDAHRSARRA